MISVQYIFNRVNKDLAKKDQTGYSSSEEFTRDLQDSENIFYKYLFDRFQKTQVIADHLEPFLVEKEIPIISGYVAYPEDHRHPSEMAYFKVIKGEDCDEPTTEECPMIPLHANEERDTLKSYIRKPSFEKGLFYFTPVNGKIRVRPMSLIGSVLYKYFKNPTYGVYNVNIVNEVEVYDPNTSVDLEWNIQSSTHLINLMLFQKGIAIKSDPVVQYAMVKNKSEAIVE